MACAESSKLACSADLPPLTGAGCRGAKPATHYLVGTPKGRLSQLEKAFLDRPWEEVRPSVQVKLLEHDGEVYVLAQSADRVGKEHRSWSLVENRRVRANRIVQRQVLYLGEINDSQQAAWRRTIDVFAEGQARPRQMALFPEDRALPGCCTARPRQRVTPASPVVR